LGTAEIGFNYGIGDRPLPTEAEAIVFLEKAVALGINFFDTANYYGLAEERLGQSGILKDSATVVETKCAQFLERGEYFSSEELEAKIRAQITDSLTKLKLATLPIVMLHGPSATQINDGVLIEILQKLKQEGLLNFIGASTRSEEPALAAIESDAIDVIQVAYSILDQRMAKKVLPLAREKNVGVVNRSVLLKGALTPLRAKLPAGLEPLKARADEIEAVAKELNLDLPTLAIRFATSNPDIAVSLIGTNKIANVEKAVSAVGVGPLPQEIISRLEKLALDDINQIDPAKWPPLQ
jgi:L-galactose dehydrogenase